MDDAPVSGDLGGSSLGASAIFSSPLTLSLQYSGLPPHFRLRWTQPENNQVDTVVGEPTEETAAAIQKMQIYCNGIWPSTPTDQN